MSEIVRLPSKGICRYSLSNVIGSIAGPRLSDNLYGRGFQYSVHSGRYVVGECVYVHGVGVTEDYGRDGFGEQGHVTLPQGFGVEFGTEQSEDMRRGAFYNGYKDVVVVLKGV